MTRHEAGRRGAILDFDGVAVPLARDGANWRTLDVHLAPGAMVVLDAGGPEVERALVDIALGLAVPAAGTMRLLGHDWQTLPQAYAAALRGRVGFVPNRGGWLGHLPTAANLLLRQRYHRRTPTDQLIREAGGLAARFLLPGIPLDPIAAMHPRDRLRAACVRAFLGEPILVVVETPFETTWGSLLEPLMVSFQEVRERGGAVLWCLSDDPLFDDPTLPADGRLRLRAASQPEAAA